jgi:hypothetical protein
MAFSQIESKQKHVSTHYGDENVPDDVITAENQDQHTGELAFITTDEGIAGEIEDNTLGGLTYTDADRSNQSLALFLPSMLSQFQLLHPMYQKSVLNLASGSNPSFCSEMLANKNVQIEDLPDENTEHDNGADESMGNDEGIEEIGETIGVIETMGSSSGGKELMGNNTGPLENMDNDTGVLTLSGQD